MRAIVLPEYGPASALQLRTLPDPTPAANEIAVRMAGASVNPVDWKQRSGALKAYMPLTLPAVLGRDVSGTVAALGPGVTAFAVGDRVLGRVPRGTYAEIVVAPLDSWARVPAKLDLADAGALPLVLLTGAQLAEEAVDARAGETIVVAGATGGVGRVTVFAAKARGAKVWAGVRGKYKAAAQALGADGVVVLDDGGGDLAKLPALDGIANTIFGDAIQPLLGKLKPGGKIGSVGRPAGGRGGARLRRARIHDARRSEAARRAGTGGRGRQAGHPDREALPARRGARGPRAREAGVAGKVLLLG